MEPPAPGPDLFDTPRIPCAGEPFRSPVPGPRSRLFGPRSPVPSVRVPGPLLPLHSSNGAAIKASTDEGAA